MKKKSLRIETPERHLGAVDEMEEGYSPSPYPGTPYSQQSGFSATDHSEYDSEYDPENDDDLMSSALGSDYGDDDGGGGRDWIDPDVLYGDEFGYWVIKLLRGPSVGRRIKRCVFKIMLITFACNVALMVMAYLEDRMYAMSAYFSTSPYGATLQILMWLTCIPGIFMAVMSLLFLKYWSSIVTNRNLFSQMCRVYMVGYIVCLSLASWMMAVLLLMFEPVERWTDDMNLVQIFPFYLCTHIFTWPYLIVSFYYVMDISYWMDELVNANGEINEPDPPPNTIDLTDVSLNQVILLVIAFPCMITVQLLDLIYALFKALSRYISIRRQQMADVAERKRTAKEEADEDARSGRSSVWDRAKRTAKRRLKQLCFCCCNSGGGSKMPKAGATTPVDQDFPEFPDSPMGSPQRGAAGGSALAGFGTPNRETQERLERERATEEQERRIAKKQAEIDAQVAEDAARAAEEKERLAALEAAEAKKREELEKETSKPFLEVSSFRTMWGTLANSGSFQCKLKSTPSLVALIDHLKRQGFHVVFAAQPKADEVEVGICNIRSDGQGPWFLARFLASSGSFSAVMKSEDPAATSKYVKKFALAKTLKIDTNHMRNTPVKSAGDGPIPGAK
jgi:hypothetical protein